jgi:hypothetical protein
MPYEIVYVKGSDRPWKIRNTQTNRVVGSSKTKADAQASVRARYANESNRR